MASRLGNSHTYQEKTLHPRVFSGSLDQRDPLPTLGIRVISHVFDLIVGDPDEAARVFFLLMCSSRILQNQERRCET